MNNYTPTKWMAWKEWINSQKSITFQLNQEEIENMSRSITSMKFEIVIKKKIFQQTAGQGQLASQANSTETLEKS